MKTIRLFAAAAAALLFLAGCARDMQTATVSGEGGFPLAEGSEIGLSYDYSIEYIDGGLPREVTEKINAAIVRNLLYDEAEDGLDVPEACLRWAGNCEAAYRAETEELADGVDADAAWMFNWSYSAGGAFTTACKARNWQSYRSTAGEYTGGAHGMYGETYQVFDLGTGETVREADFLDPACTEELAELMTGRILTVLEEADAADALLGNPYPNGNFSVDDAGVTWHFNPYEIAPYAMGVLEASLRWEELKPFLK